MSRLSERWQQLHVRVARGEPLTGEERIAYEAGLRSREQDERLAPDIAALREAREALARLASEHGRLVQKRAELDAEIAGLEAALAQTTATLSS